MFLCLKLYFSIEKNFKIFLIFFLTIKIMCDIIVFVEFGKLKKVIVKKLKNR